MGINKRTSAFHSQHAALTTPLISTTLYVDAIATLIRCVDKDMDDSAVSMAHRAPPLINLLNAAAKDGCDVMWE